MSRKSKAKTFSLRTKIIGSLTIFLIVISASLYYYLTESYIGKSNALIKRQVGLITTQLEVSSELFLLNKDVVRFNSFLSIEIRKNKLLYFTLYDTTGKAIKNISTSEAIQKMGKNDFIYNPKDIIPVVSKVLNKDAYLGSISFGILNREFVEALRRTKIESAEISCGILFSGLFFIIIFGYVFTSPIKKIVATAEKIAGGDHTERINLKNKGEFAIISNSINHLAEYNQEADAQITHLNKQLKTAFRDKLGELNLEINQRRLAEDSLKKSEEQFRLLFDIAPIGMAISTPEKKITKVNQAYINTLGYSNEELIKMNTTNLTHYEDREMDALILKDFLTKDLDSKNYEKRFITKNGSIIDAIVRITLHRNEKGRPVQFIEQVIDITERKQMEKELIFSKEKAEESDKMKSAFLAQMSHEIRTPLNVILAASSILEEDLQANLDEDSREVVNSVKSAGKRLLRTIDLILNMSAIQTGKYQADFESVDLNAELKKMVDEFKTLSSEKKIHLTFSSHIKNAEIKADKYTLLQIFQNLISNAIKYTREGKVDVTVFKTNKIFVEVKDTGIGMSKEYMNNLFNAFSQEYTGHKREFEGNGLGLALVKKYVEINNATINVESEKNRGSTFTVIF